MWLQFFFCTVSCRSPSSRLNHGTPIMNTLSTLDVAIVAVYFGVVLAVGMYFRKRNKTSTEYFLAGRNVGWIAIGASLFATNISSEHFLGLAGTGSKSGLAVGQFEWLAILVLLLLGWVFTPFYLRSGVFTMPEFLERRYWTCIPLLPQHGLHRRICADEDLHLALRRRHPAADGCRVGYVHLCGRDSWSRRACTPSWGDLLR